MFHSFYKNKKVLVTGHTGFKGSWLVSWLRNLGADVYGFSENILPFPSHYELLNVKNKINHFEGDIRDTNLINNTMEEIKPDVVFHLAAQAIVSTSYSDPVGTISTNVLGTVNVLEALRKIEHKCAALIITSDKCYENNEWIWGYREIDRLGGKDIYSASKASAELLIRSYLESFFTENHKVSIAIARAGNVIGGGDWAKDRIVPDIYRSWSSNNSVEIRSPNSTRPWQHVLEPISGYLTLVEKLWSNRKYHAEAYNFGPLPNVDKSVIELVKKLSDYWDKNNLENKYLLKEENVFSESKLLRLNCDKAYSDLSWAANLNFEQTAEFVGKWYADFYLYNKSAEELTFNNIKSFENLAKMKNLRWSHD